MNLFRHFRDSVVHALDALAAAGKIPAGLDVSRVAVEPPREEGHGDLSTNAAMVLSKAAGMKSRDLAELLAERLQRLDSVTEVTVAGPGFINFRLADAFWQARLADVLQAGTSYGSSRLGNDGVAVAQSHMAVHVVDRKGPIEGRRQTQRDLHLLRVHERGEPTAGVAAVRGRKWPAIPPSDRDLHASISTWGRAREPVSASASSLDWGL